MRFNSSVISRMLASNSRSRRVATPSLYRRALRPRLWQSLPQQDDLDKHCNIKGDHAHGNPPMEVPGHLLLHERIVYDLKRGIGPKANHDVSLHRTQHGHIPCTEPDERNKNERKHNFQCSLRG